MPAMGRIIAHKNAPPGRGVGGSARQILPSRARIRITIRMVPRIPEGP